ncbi:MAG TPA: hypothetical protein DD414_03795 [Lachnospiraceae bacterium]|nr:hypothetical protein [Lachnospiraceae bacterium]
MDKYEYHLKINQIEKLLKKKDYETAAEIADTIDWRRVKNLNMLYVVGDIYEKTKRYEDCMEILAIAYDRAPVGRMLLYKMTNIATQMHHFDEAISLYREFVKAAPQDQSRFVLKYQIYHERGSSLEDQIKILQEYKSHEYHEKWAYELASLYARAGMTEECVRECDELILWFSDGEYVAKALELKMQYEPLTAAQQEKYDRTHTDGIYKEAEVPAFNMDKFSTMNLQAELAANLGELFKENATIEIPPLEVDEQPSGAISLEELPMPEQELSPEEEEGARIILESLAFHGEDDNDADIELKELDFSDEEDDLDVELAEIAFPAEEGSGKAKKVISVEDNVSQESEEDLQVELEELGTFGGESIPEEPEEDEIDLEELSGFGEESAVQEPEEEAQEIDLEELSGFGEESAVQEPEEEAQEIDLEELSGFGEESTVQESEEEAQEIDLEEQSGFGEENAVSKPGEDRSDLEEFSGFGEKSAVQESEEAQGIDLEELGGLGIESEGMSDIGEKGAIQEPEEEAQRIDLEDFSLSEEDMFVGEAAVEPSSIDDILSEWANKKAEAEAILEAGAKQEQERKEKVKQETAELMKLIAGISNAIPEDVQQILEEIDEEKKQKEATVVSAEPSKEIPDMEDEPEEDGEAIAFEDLEDLQESTEPSVVPQRNGRPVKNSASGNMIQDLGRSLTTGVSEMAVNAGHLTREQARLFTYFTSVKGMSQQLSVLFKNTMREGKANSSRGNLVITGDQGNGKTTLAIDIVKALQKQNRISGKKLAKVSGQRLNKKDIYEVLVRLKGGALIIEGAGGLSDVSLMALSLAMEADTGGLLVILEDTAEEVQKLFLKNKNFASKFDYHIDIPVFTNDELVNFGKAYAQEYGYTFDEFGVLALYNQIGSRQTNDHLVTVAEVKDIIDAAMEHAEKGGVRHLFERVTKKSVDEFGNRLLREVDFT